MAEALVSPKGITRYLAEGDIEGCLPFVSFPYTDQKVSIPEIKLGEDGGSLQRLKSGTD